jgi:hypothetical protein
MPDIKGIHLYRILKKLNLSIKVMFLTFLDCMRMLTTAFLDLVESDIMKEPIGR